MLTSSGMIRTPPKITAVDPNIVLHMATSLSSRFIALGGWRVDDHKGNAGPASSPCVQQMEGQPEQSGQVMDLLKEAGIGDRS